MTLPVQDCQCS